MALGCVPLSAYCQSHGESSEQVKKRIQRGVWLEGVHVLRIDGVRERWVDLDEVAKWARQNSIAG